MTRDVRTRNVIHKRRRNRGPYGTPLALDASLVYFAGWAGAGTIVRDSEAGAVPGKTTRLHPVKHAAARPFQIAIRLTNSSRARSKTAISPV